MSLKRLFLFFLIFKELQVLQREKDSLYKEKEELSARLLEGEEAREGSII